MKTMTPTQTVPTTDATIVSCTRAELQHAETVAALIRTALAGKDTQLIQFIVS